MKGARVARRRDSGVAEFDDDLRRGLELLAMLRGALRWGVVLAVVAMLGGHFTELFDRWDHTLRTGKDADYAVVMVAACAGVVAWYSRSPGRYRRFSVDCGLSQTAWLKSRPR